MKDTRFFEIGGETITSRQNPLVKELCALTEKKHRERLGRFRFDGLKLCEEAIRAKLRLETVVVKESALARADEWLFSRLGNAPVGEWRTVVVSDGVFEKISEEKSPDGVICVAKALDKIHKMTTINNIPENLSAFSADGKDARVLFLHELRDPGNVGTILRTAAAFGVDCVLLSRDSAEICNPRTLRAAMGAAFRLPTLRIDGETADAVRALRAIGRRVYATALDETAEELGSFALRATDCFVIGNEGHGLPAEVISACTNSVYIPMEAGNESLNAAMAAGILMWEISRA